MKTIWNFSSFCLIFVWISVSFLYIGGVRGNSVDQSTGVDSQIKLGDAPSRSGPGAWIYQTHGEIWPKPQIQNNIDNSKFRLDPTKFTFRPITTSKSCDVILKAIDRYHDRISEIFSSFEIEENLRDRPVEQFQGGELREVTIALTDANGCHQYPDDDMDESYEITISSLGESEIGSGLITARTNWGIIRGMESFTQLIISEKGQNGHNLVKVKSTFIRDFPRFSYRGILLDSARHFIPKDLIIDNLNLMEMNKFNILHWHITDSVSFPYQSVTFPELSEKGAYSPNHVYSQQDVSEIIEAARIRGIRVVPEFDTPDHSDSLGASHPELLTKCEHNDKSYRSPWNYGPINPIKESVYTFLGSFFKEIASVFPDKFMHIGGDEVNTACWQRDSEIQDFMRKHQISGRYDKLESLYFNRLIEKISNLPQKKRTVVWQDVLDDGAKIKNDSIIQIWKNGGPGCWQEMMKQVTSQGFEAVLSAPWYLDHITYARDWLKYYAIDPEEFEGTETEKSLVKGGTACLWAEYVNRGNFIPRLWPRASAIAERLWSSKKTQIKDVEFVGCNAWDYDGDTGNGDACWSEECKDAERRMQEQECRMAKRGYAVSPSNGPSFCDLP